MLVLPAGAPGLILGSKPSLHKVDAALFCSLWGHRVMKKIKTGIIGTGFIGPVHVEALRRIGFVEVAAVAERGQPLAQAKADALSIPKAYGDYHDMLADPEIQVVHNCTPNHLHFEINKEILAARQARRLREAAGDELQGVARAGAAGERRPAS